LTNYFKGFMKHHRKVLKSKKPCKFPKDWKDWATYENINKIYDNVYQAMVDCGIAHYMDEEEVNTVLENPQPVLFVCWWVWNQHESKRRGESQSMTSHWAYQ
jgi:hypothetical protein